MNQKLILQLIPVLIAFAAQQSLAGDTLTELKQCRAETEAEKRLACYDNLVDAAPLESGVAEDLKNPLDELGSENLSRKEREVEKIEVQATVTECKRNSRNKMLFYFENGQIWRQANDKRLSYRSCKFDVTITKDVFGYKMQPAGENRRIRIARIK